MIGTYHTPGSTTRSGLLVLSDMEDNFPMSAREREETGDAAAGIREARRVGGMYWVAMPYMQVWQRHLRESGLKEFVIESEIVGRSELPRFEF